MTEPTQLERLAKPFPKRLIHENPSGGGSYVKHSVVTEKLLAVVGAFDFELVEVIRGDVAGREPDPSGRSARAKRGAPPLSGSIVGAVCRLSAEVDGKRARVEEAGDCEDPHNWPHDGARLKDAMSDALKRCAMRLGVTLHLWSGAEFSLYEQLQNANKGAGADPSDRGGDVAHDGSDGANSQDVGRTDGEPAPITSPAAEVGEHPAAANGGDVSSSPPTSRVRREKLKSAAISLESEGFNVRAAVAKWQLPKVDDCDERQLNLYDEMLHDLESGMFEKADA